MITFTLQNGLVATLRTSGTEPKIKCYAEYCAPPGNRSADSSFLDLTQGQRSHAPWWLAGAQPPTRLLLLRLVSAESVLVQVNHTTRPALCVQVGVSSPTVSVLQ